MEAPEDRVVAAEGTFVEWVDSDGNVLDPASTDANGNHAFDSVTQSVTYQVRVAASDEWDVEGTGTRDLTISNGDEDMDRIDCGIVV